MQTKQIKLSSDITAMSAESQSPLSSLIIKPLIPKAIRITENNQGKITRQKYLNKNAIQFHLEGVKNKKLLKTLKYQKQARVFRISYEMSNENIGLHIYNFLKRVPKLDTLQFNRTYNPYRDRNMVEISKNIKNVWVRIMSLLPKIGLKDLEIDSTFNQVSKEVVTKFWKHFFRLKELRNARLNLTGNELETTEFKNDKISKGLNSMKKLEYLKLSFEAEYDKGTYTSKNCYPLLEQIYSKTKLKKIDLSIHNLQDTENLIEGFTDVIASRNDLTELHWALPDCGIGEAADGYRNSAAGFQNFFEALKQYEDLETFEFEFTSYPPFNIDDFDALFNQLENSTKLKHLRIKVPYRIAQDSTNYFWGSYDHDRVLDSFPKNAFAGCGAQLLTLHLNFAYSIKFTEAAMNEFFESLTPIRQLKDVSFSFYQSFNARDPSSLLLFKSFIEQNPNIEKFFFDFSANSPNENTMKKEEMDKYVKPKFKIGTLQKSISTLKKLKYLKLNYSMNDYEVDEMFLLQEELKNLKNLEKFLIAMNNHGENAHSNPKIVTGTVLALSELPNLDEIDLQFSDCKDGIFEEKHGIEVTQAIKKMTKLEYLQFYVSTGYSWRKKDNSVDHFAEIKKNYSRNPNSMFELDNDSMDQY